MEENEDEPEDVRLATPVEDEIKKAEEPARGNTKFQKTRVKDNKKKRKKEDEDEDCCSTKKKMKQEKEPKWGTFHIFEQECKLPKPYIVPRHCLSKKEHLDMLATPSRKCEPQCLKKSVTRKLKVIPPRIVELARPTTRRILRTIEDRGDTIAPELLDNLIKMIEAESSLSPEQAAQLFHDKDSRSSKKCKKKRGKIKCDSKKEKEKRKENGNYPLFDPEAVCCQYQMAEQFVKNILNWKCPMPREEFKDIAEVILKRLSFVLEYTPIDNGDRKSQQMRFLADVISCWISGVLLEVAEAHRKELEEECERMKQVEDEETEEEEESENETQSTMSAKSNDEPEEEEEEDNDEEKSQEDKSGKTDEDKEDKGDQDKKPDEESATQAEEQKDMVEEGEVEGEEMSDGGKADEEEAERRRAEEEGAERQRLEEAEVERKKAEEEEALARKIEEEENERKRLEEEEAEKARLEEEEAAKRKVEEEAERVRLEEEAKQKEIEEAERMRIEDEAKQKEIEEAERMRIEDEAKQKEIEEAERIRREDEAKQKEIEEAERIRVQDEAEKMEEVSEEKGKEDDAIEVIEEGKIQEVEKPTDDELVSKRKEFITTDTGPLMKDLFQPDLPFVTFNQIFKTIYNMIEKEEENTREDPVVNRLHRAVYERFYNAVLAENPEILTDNAKDVIDVVTGKIAIWLSKVLTESEILHLEKYPPEVESKEVRDWSMWMKSTTQRAADWTTWLQSLIKEGQQMQHGQVTRGQYEDWTTDLHRKAVLLRQFHLDTVHKAHHNVMMIKDRDVVKTGNRKIPEYPEEELKVVNFQQ